MKVLIIIASVLVCPMVFAKDNYGYKFNSGTNTQVNRYLKSNGTYVQPHVRTAPDNSKLNNYSTQGNVNPYTGKVGTKPLTQQHNYTNTNPPGSVLDNY